MTGYYLHEEPHGLVIELFDYKVLDKLTFELPDRIVEGYLLYSSKKYLDRCKNGEIEAVEDRILYTKDGIMKVRIYDMTSGIPCEIEKISDIETLNNLVGYQE